MGDVGTSLNNVHNVLESIVKFGFGVIKSAPAIVMETLRKALNGASNKGDLIKAIIGALSGATDGLDTSLAKGLSNTLANSLSSKQIG